MHKKKERLQAAIWLSKMLQAYVIDGENIKKILNEFGGLIGVFNANYKSLNRVICSGKEKEKFESFINSSSKRLEALQDANNYLEYYNDIKMEVISYNEPKYPPLLKQISSAPSILFYLSKTGIDVLQRFCIGVIGTRMPTSYGENITKKIISGFYEKNVLIVSGMARGIDSIAHKCAIENKILTAGVIGSGLDIVYPPENRALMKEIMEKGILISEYPPGMLPKKSSFPARNRIISGLSTCIVITEAAQKSGTMITAGYAADQGRDVFAVPGSVFSSNSVGTNKLIKDGAQVILSAEDIIDNYSYNNWFNET